MNRVASNAIKGQPLDLEPDYKRREAFIAAYFETGSLTKATQIAGVHMNTGQVWRRQKWFEQAISELKKSLDRQMDGRITKLLARTLDFLEDRIENGDTKAFSNKFGVEKVQVPVSARDLAIVTGVLFDKRAALRKDPEDDDNAESALERIADRLRQYTVKENKDPLRDTAVVDVEDNSDLC